MGIESTVPVSYNPCAFTLEKSHESGDIITLLSFYIQHSLPDPGQVSQIEDVVELGWCGQHFCLQCQIMLWHHHYAYMHVW